MKVSNKQNQWIFYLGSWKGNFVLFSIFVGTQQKDRQNSTNLNNDCFCRLSVTSAQCIIVTVKYPDASRILIFDDDFSQGHDHIEEPFRAQTKDDNLQP